MAKKLDNVCALIRDNCSTNKSLPAKCNIPLIVCFSHILNLAVKKFLFEKTQNMKDLIAKVAELMRVLKTSKGAARLRKITHLAAVKKMILDGLYQYDMLARFDRLAPVLSTLSHENDVTHLRKDLAIKRKIDLTVK
jgi:hypothetical protein